MTLPRWIRATWVGWIAAIPIVALFAFFGEGIGFGGAQIWVGAGMGTGVGICQGRALRGTLGRAAPWTWSTAVGLLPPFLLADVLRSIGYDSRYAVYAALAIGGITTGIWQAYLLRKHAPQFGWWVLISAFGWTLAAITAGLGDALPRTLPIRGLAAALVYLGLTAVGGLVLATATGVGLVHLLHGPRGEAAPAIPEAH